MTAERNGVPLDMLFFSGHRPRRNDSPGPGCLSQWWPAPFAVAGRTFTTAEHYTMWTKAVTFDNEAVAREILATDDPRDAKRLGRSVAWFDEAVWTERSWTQCSRAIGGGTRRAGRCRRGCHRRFPDWGCPPGARRGWGCRGWCGMLASECCRAVAGWAGADAPLQDEAFGGGQPSAELPAADHGGPWRTMAPPARDTAPMRKTFAPLVPTTGGQDVEPAHARGAGVVALAPLLVGRSALLPRVEQEGTGLSLLEDPRNSGTVLDQDQGAVVGSSRRRGRTCPGGAGSGPGHSPVRGFVQFVEPPSASANRWRSQPGTCASSRGYFSRSCVYSTGAIPVSQ